MEGRVNTYNPRKVIVQLGTHVVSGFADDSFISIEPDGDGTTSSVGADGEIVRSIDPTNTFKIKLALQHTSETNKFLINKYYTDKNEGTGTFPILIKDLLGGTVFSCSAAWVPKLPAHGYGKTASNREYELATGSGTLQQN